MLVILSTNWQWPVIVWKKIYHASAILCFAVTLPIVIWGLWVGVDRGAMVAMLVIGTLGTLFHVLGYGAKPELATPMSVGGEVFLYVMLYLPVPLLAVVGTFVWLEISGPNGYAYDQDFEFEIYQAKDDAFTIQVPTDWRVLTPEQMIKEREGTFTPTKDAVLFIVNPQNLIENINIQITDAKIQRPNITGKEEEQLSKAAKMMDQINQKQYSSYSKIDHWIDERDGIFYGNFVLARTDLDRHLKQRAVSIVVGGIHQATIVSTALSKTYQGLNNNRFTPMIQSFRLSFENPNQ